MSVFIHKMHIKTVRLEGWLGDRHYEISVYEEYNRTAMSLSISRHGLPSCGFEIQERRKIDDCPIADGWKGVLHEAYDFYEKMLYYEDVKGRQRNI